MHTAHYNIMLNNYFSNRSQPKKANSNSKILKIQCRFCKKNPNFIALFIESELSKKHRDSQNFYYIREVNDICFQRTSMYKIRFNENNYFDDEKENLKRFYLKHEVRSKMRQIIHFIQDNHLIPKPQIYLQEFYEIMLVHSLKLKQNIQLKISKGKQNPLEKNNQQFHHFNILEGLNFIKIGSENKPSPTEMKALSGCNSDEFSRFLNERRIKIEVSLIKKNEEMNESSISKISQFIFEQKTTTTKIPIKNLTNNKIITFKKTSNKYAHNPIIKNPILIKTKPKPLNSTNNSSKKSFSDNKIPTIEPKKTPRLIDIAPYALQITPLSFQSSTFREKNIREKISRSQTKSNTQSPNTCYNRFFIPEKFVAKNTKKKEINLKSHKSLKSNEYSENKKGNLPKKIKNIENLNNKGYGDEYMLLSERKAHEEMAFDRRLGKSFLWLL